MKQGNRMQFVFFGLLLLAVFSGYSQGSDFQSIHQIQQEHYRHWSDRTISFFDSINGFSKSLSDNIKTNNLGKRVFGYQPYWGGSNYLNYQWDKLTDLCYFSYEVDPGTGLPTTIHDWYTSPAIDSALINGLKVHLCVTLFSGHALFFGNETAKQSLIDQIIDLIINRNAHGVNMDVEALPSSQAENFSNFMIDLSTQLSAILPEAEVSIAAPAVNWSNKFNIPLLKDYIDFFMVMAYDYYWNGSGEAGPVSPLYSMTSYYDYNFSKTISYYQLQGVPDSMLVMGVPYYAYQWPTQGQYAPSSTTASGTAYTYANIKNNSSGNYSPGNKHREPNSFAPYYSFQAGGWYQCFLDDVYSMGKKFDIVNRRGLGGIGIWALGYDNGYSDFWDLIGEKFSNGNEASTSDTIFDSGGPSWDYYNDENYLYTITTPENTQVNLSFSYLELESGYDSLWIFDGPDSWAGLIGVYTGDSIPPLIVASGHHLSFKFNSDAGITAPGWRAVYDTMPVSGIYNKQDYPSLFVFPNPTRDRIVVFNGKRFKSEVYTGIIYSITLQSLKKFLINPGDLPYTLDISDLPAGVYLLQIGEGNHIIATAKIVKQ
jgi:hypothetical protein